MGFFLWTCATGCYPLVHVQRNRFYMVDRQGANTVENVGVDPGVTEELDRHSGRAFPRRVSHGAATSDRNPRTRAGACLQALPSD